MWETVPITDDNHPLCMSYHMKGVCNSNYDGRHAHRRLYSMGHVRLSAWKEKFYGSVLPLVMDMDARSLGGSTITTKIRRPRSTRGGSGGGGRSTHYPPAWTLQGNDDTTATTEVEDVGYAGNWQRGHQWVKCRPPRFVGTARLFKTFLCPLTSYRRANGISIGGSKLKPSPFLRILTTVFKYVPELRPVPEELVKSAQLMTTRATEVGFFSPVSRGEALRS